MASLLDTLSMKFQKDEPPFDTALTPEELVDIPWYYTVELSPGVFSRGENFSNVAITRELLARIDVRGQTCLDIGTMEGFVPTLLSRRGTRHVVAYDRIRSFEHRLETVKQTYGVSFDFVSGGKIVDLRVRLGDQCPFDVVVLSGVIYHQMDPFAGLAAARSMVRNGGIMLVETSAVISNGMIAFFNEKNRFGGHSYFLLSLATLDYMLRFLRLRVIDCLYIPSHRDEVHDLDICRVALTCRAETAPIGPAEDEFVHGSILTETDLREFIDWSSVRNTLPPVPYDTTKSVVRQHSDVASVDVYGTVAGNPPFQFDPSRVTLRLADRE